MKAILMRLMYYVKPYRKFLIGAAFCAIISISLALYTPILIGQAIDKMIGFGMVDAAGIIQILIILAAVILCSALFQWLLTICTNIITFRTVRDLRNDAFEKISKVPLQFIDGRAHGDVINRIVNDVDFVADGLLLGITQLFTGVVTILGTLIFMLTMNPFITLVVVLVTPLSIFVASFIAKRSHHMFRLQSKTQGEISGYAEELIGNQKVVIAFGYDKRAQKKFEEINTRLYDCGLKAQFYSAISNPSTRFVNGIVYAAVGIIGAVNAINGRISIGQISAFLTYANQYTKPFNEVTGILTQLQTAFSAAQRIFSILDEPAEPAEPEISLVIKNCRGEVSLKDVAFSYKKDVPLIENLSLTVKAGERVAIVGPTGSGKTTIVNLLMRFYDISQGEITVDGINIQNMKRSQLRSLFGMVLQDTWLFTGSVKENIAYGKPDATEEEIIQAAKSAHAHSFIKRLPQGYDTIISEGASNISAGQRQLLSIARIMLTHPPILILDEATSNIDALTEIRIQKAFDEMMKGRTSFVVAHRLSTVREADVILVMQNGRIVEQGNHNQLLKQNGFYAKLYNSQFSV